LPAINSGMAGIPKLEHHGADLDPPPYDLPLPDEAAEPPTLHPPEQILPPTKAGGKLESLWGETLQRAIGQTSPAPARAPEGKTPTGEAHGHPHDLPDLQTQGFTVWEPESDDPRARVRTHQARMPVLDEGARPRSDPWPSLGIVNVDSDTCIGSTSQLKGGQNIHIPSVGSELHAAPSAPQNFPSSFSPFPSPPDTLAHKNLSRGEGAASEWRAIDIHPERWKPPDLPVENLEESGGASASDDSPILHGSAGGLDCLGLARVVADADAKELEPSSVDAHERGGALPVVGAAPALAEETTGVEPAGKAERAAAAKSEALAPWTQGETRREVETLQEGKREADEPPPEALPQKGERKPQVLPPKAPGACSRRRRKRLGANPRRCHQRASTNSTRCRKGTRTRVNASLTGCHEKCRARHCDRVGENLTRRREWTEN